MSHSEEWEAGYLAGQRVRRLADLRDALRDLAIDDSDPVVAFGRATLQLEETRDALRKLCRTLGHSTDWSDHLWLPDVIELIDKLLEDTEEER